MNTAPFLFTAKDFVTQANQQNHLFKNGDEETTQILSQYHIPLINTNISEMVCLKFDLGNYSFHLDMIRCSDNVAIQLIN